MSLISVDPTKCKRDGICASDCPLKLIQLAGREAFPAPVKQAEQICINCGHCVAVCPHGALSLSTMSPEECEPLSRDLLPTPEQARLLLTGRRSVRTYKKEPVDRSIIVELIDVARYAPTGHNVQPVNWLVIEDTGEVKRLAGLVADWMRFMLKAEPLIARSMHMDMVVAAWDLGIDTILRGAPHVIITHAPGENPMAGTSCTIALTYLELATFSRGLGACWAGFLHAASIFYPPLLQALQLPDGHKCFGAMMVGHPKHQYHRVPKRKEATITWR